MAANVPPIPPPPPERTKSGPLPTGAGAFDGNSPTLAGGAPEFSRLLDLASSRLGGLAIGASDDFFAEQDGLLKPEPAVFIPDKYTERGKWMDGWESRRRRGVAYGDSPMPDYHDWCVVRLGLPGVIKGVNIDTSHFLGNHPPFAAIDGIHHSGRLTYRDKFDSLPWKELLAPSPLARGSHNFHAVNNSPAVTHIRLRIFPDGGVARLRVHGVVAPDLKRFAPGEIFDLAAIENGGVVISANDMFFGPKDNLVMPGRGSHMGDGWETRRRRGDGYDWVIVRLGAAGRLARLIIDTCHFKGNYPDRCQVEGINAPGTADSDVERASPSEWVKVLPETLLEGHKVHDFGVADGKARGPFTHVRLSTYPDGGISRMRVLGSLT